MEPTTPRSHRSSRPRPVTPREKPSSSGVRARVSCATPSTPRTKSSEFLVSTPSTVHTDSASLSALEDDFPFDSSGEWSVTKSSFQTPKRELLQHSLTREKLRQIQSCSPLHSPQEPGESAISTRSRRRMSTRTENSAETNESNDSSRRSSPRRRPRRTTSVKLEEEFLVLAPTTPITEPIPQTPRRTRRSSSIEPRRRRTASVERRRTGGGGDLPPRRRLSMTKIGSVSPQTPETLTSPAARRLARHAQSVQQLTREKPLLRNNSMEELLPW